MGRNAKEYKRLEVKLDRFIADALERYIMHNPVDLDVHGERRTLNKMDVVERALLEYLREREDLI